MLASFLAQKILCPLRRRILLEPGKRRSLYPLWYHLLQLEVYLPSLDLVTNQLPQEADSRVQRPVLIRGPLHQRLEGQGHLDDKSGQLQWHPWLCQSVSIIFVFLLLISLTHLVHSIRSLFSLGAKNQAAAGICSVKASNAVSNATPQFMKPTPIGKGPELDPGKGNCATRSDNACNCPLRSVTSVAAARNPSPPAFSHCEGKRRQGYQPHWGTNYEGALSPWVGYIWKGRICHLRDFFWQVGPHCKVSSVLAAANHSVRVIPLRGPIKFSQIFLHVLAPNSETKLSKATSVVPSIIASLNSILLESLSATFHNQEITAGFHE